MMPINLKVGILIKRRGKLLLIHERQTETGKLKWNIVKGTVDPSDRTLTAAAIREVREEVGLRIHPAGILNIAQRLRRKHSDGTSEFSRNEYARSSESIVKEVSAIIE